MSNCPGIRISELTTMNVVGRGDYIVINDDNTFTKRIALQDFISSVNADSSLNFATYAKDVILVPPGGTPNPLWLKIATNQPPNQEIGNNYILNQLVANRDSILTLNTKVENIETNDKKYATTAYVDNKVAAEKQERVSQDDVLMNIKADKYNHYTKAEIDQMLEEVVIDAGGLTDAPDDGFAYGREDKAWVKITKEAPTDGKIYSRKDGAWVESEDGVTNLALDNRNDETLEITSSSGTDVTIPAATNVLAGLMTAADKAALTQASQGTSLALDNRDQDSMEITSSSGSDVVLPAVTPTLAGLMTATDKTNLDDLVATGGETNLATGNITSTTLDVTSSTGTDATLPAATQSLAGLMTGADKTKLDNIGQTMDFKGSVDLTDSTTIPGSALDGDSYANTVDGQSDAGWAAVSDLTVGDVVSAGDLVIYNGSSWNHIPTGGSQYTDDDVDAHLNAGTATDGQILSYTSGDYLWVDEPEGFSGDYNDLTNKPTIPAAYTDADVDAHLNQSTAQANYVLEWSGTDYTWVSPNSVGGTYGDSDVEALLGAYNFHLIPGTNATYDIGTAEKKVRHLFLSDNSLRFVDAGDNEYPLSVEAGPVLTFNGEALALKSEIPTLPGTPDLQAVTDAGNTTTHGAAFGGDVGINTSTNSSRSLDILKSSTNDYNIRVQTDANSKNSGAIINFFDGKGTPTAGSAAQNFFTCEGNDFTFSNVTNSDVSSDATEKLRIQQNGVVKVIGTGTTADPVINFGADGTADFDSQLSASNLVVNDGVGAQTTLLLARDSGNNVFAVSGTSGLGNVGSVLIGGSNALSDPNISLNASGAASFAGNVDIGGDINTVSALRLFSNGSISSRSDIANANQAAWQYYNGGYNDASRKFELKSDGSVLLGGTFPNNQNIKLNANGTVTALNFDIDALTTLP